MIQGFDCATKLTTKTATGLKNSGFEYAIRYLPTTAWKGLTKEEVKAIQDAGLKLVSIFQRSANFAGYFTIAQGRADGVQAKKLAESLGQPKGTAIYFAVDYDAQPKNIGGVLAYFKGVKETLRDYKIGVYGSYRVMNEVLQKEPVDYYWQTYAWSYGKIADHIHFRQYKNGVTVAGVQLDRNNIKNTPGAWTEVMKEHPKQPPKKEKRTAKNGKYTVVSGDTLSHIAADFGVSVKDLVNWNGIKDKNVIQVGQVITVVAPKPQPKPEPKEDKYTLVTSVKGYYRAEDAENRRDDRTLVAKGTYYVFNRAKIGKEEMINVTTRKGVAGSWINPADNTENKPKPQYYTVRKNDNLSKIAAAHKTTVSQLVAWNNIKNPNLIFPGQKLRIK